MRIITSAIADSNTEIHVAFSQREFGVGYILAEDITVCSAIGVDKHAVYGGAI